MASSLVLDEQFTSKRLILALEDRGIDVKTVADFEAKGRPDPDVVRRIADGCDEEGWVLVTMDTTILEDFAGFDWSRYAIAWVVIDDHLLGAAVERAKSNIVQRHAHTMIDQKADDHFTYSTRKHSKHPPSLAKLLGRKGAN